MPVWAWMLVGVAVIAGGFWLDVRLGLVLIEALPVLGGGIALYKVIRTARTDLPERDPPASSTNADHS